MSVQLPQQRLTVPADVDEEAFFTTEDGRETLVTHADLEHAVPNDEKPHLEELQRYWVNKPYAFIVLYNNVRDSELRYYVVEPRLSPLEHEIVNFFKDKLRTSLNYDNVTVDATPRERSRIVRNEAIALMKRYNLLGADSDIAPTSISEQIKHLTVQYLQDWAERGEGGFEEEVEQRDELTAGSESQTLNSVQVRRVVYYLVRDFIRFGRIDPIKNDVNIEDISCNGYNSPVFVYHSEYGEQIVTNVSYGQNDLDNFVKTLAQSSGKGISRRQPNIDATLPDGSRAQLTLGSEISDGGTNFTIRQFNEIPFTPVDLINWRTFSIDQVAYLWLAIQHNKSVVFAGGTASGKTTSLNAMSLFMPSNSKIVSIEDTREVELPQSNWIANMTRESFQEDGIGTIDEFDLLEDALRKRPDYVIMGEVRGEEGQTLFQMLNTGHTTYTTFHANEPKEVVRRFTTAPINVSPSMFDALDMIIVQANINMAGKQVRRAKEVVEVGDYNASANKFSMNDAFMWDRREDEYRRRGRSSLLEEIQEERAWSDKELRREWNRRRMVLAYLVNRNINTYAGVAATIQAYMSSKDTVLGLIADDELEQRIAALHKMRTININTDPEMEALIPRPSTPQNIQQEVEQVLSETEPLLVGHDSADIDFARTVEDILGAGELTESEQDLLNEIDSSELDELPGDAESIEEVEPGDFETSSEDFRADSSFDLSLEEELDELFGEDNSDDTGQVILTSETLERLNEQEEDSETQAESATTTEDDIGEEIDDEISEEVEALFQEASDSVSDDIEKTSEPSDGETDSMDEFDFGMDDLGDEEAETIEFDDDDIDDEALEDPLSGDEVTREISIDEDDSSEDEDSLIDTGDGDDDPITIGFDDDEESEDGEGDDTAITEGEEEDEDEQ